MSFIYLYGRHSTNKQSMTEDVQRKACESYCNTFLLSQDGVEIGEPSWLYDAAVSGGKPLADRPEGMKLWALAQPGDHIVVAKLDRAFRSIIDGAQTIELFRAKGIFLHILDVRVDTSTSMGKFIVNVMLAFAQLQREYVSERTKEVVRQRKENRLGHGNTVRYAPFGWERKGKPKNFYLVESDEERAQIAQMAAWRAAGESWESVSSLCRRNRYCKLRGWAPTTCELAIEAMSRGFPKAHQASKKKRSPAKA